MASERDGPSEQQDRNEHQAPSGADEGEGSGYDDALGGHGEVEGPVPLASLEVPLPGDAPPLTEAVEVEVLLRIDTSGQVVEVQLLRGAGDPWDTAVLEASRSFRFEPARLGGAAVEVEVPFVQRFLPTAPEPARLFGRLVERGTRRAIADATIEVRTEEGRWETRSAGDGSFSLEVPPGDARVVVVGAGYERFTVSEALRAGDALEVRYLVDRSSYDPYETVVVGTLVREEVSRVSLGERELQRVPGTFGDPFRVVDTMPGVTQMMSLVSYPIVRGSNPGTSGFLIDGVRVPQLFHYLAGPAVVHPSFIERVDFFPGNFPVEYGGYTGGIVDGITRRSRPGESTVDLGLDLFNSSLFVREPTAWGGLTFAGRYGYPGLLLEAFSGGEIDTSYWDYQARLDGGGGRNRFTIFAFGSHDRLETPDTLGGTTFHRLDLRYRTGTDESHDLYRVTFGFDRSFTPQFHLDTLSIDPRARWQRRLSPVVSLRMGADVALRSSFGSAELDDGLRVNSSFALAGLFFDTPLHLTEDFVLTPGLRVDAYDGGGARQVAFDPRLGARYRLLRDESRELWLKGGVGLYHQPPRFLIPIPGADDMALDMGLPGSVQTSGGAELHLATGWDIDAQLFYSHMDPILLEPALLPEVEGDDDPLELLKPKTGRAYGLELLLRKRASGRFFGWLSYTLSRSERLEDGAWSVYDFDRPHTLQAVAGVRMPRDWEIGARFQVQSGRPIREVEGGYRRLPPFTRLDLRIDRRVVYNQWMLDFYVDLINVMLTEEPLGDEQTPLRYLLPTVGFRAVL